MSAPYQDKRVIADGRAVLYLGDCLKILPWLQARLHLECGAGRIDAIIADPPYGIGYQHSGGGGGKHARRNSNMPVAGDEVPFDPRPIIAAAPNVLLWGADHFCARLPDSGRFLAFNKLGDLEPWDSFSDVEFAWHSADSAARVFSLKWKGIVQDKAGEANGKRWHPTQKPVALMAWCLDQAGTAAGDLICDPYMGSGTTGVACMRTARRFVGMELEREYFEIAATRIEEAARQGSLFTQPAPPKPQDPGQSELLP